MSKMHIETHVNGESAEFLCEAQENLLTVLRDRLGLTRYTQAQMLELLQKNGFAAQRAPKNIGHNQGRMLFLASRE